MTAKPPALQATTYRMSSGARAARVVDALVWLGRPTVTVFRSQRGTAAHLEVTWTDATDLALITRAIETFDPAAVELGSDGDADIR